MQCVPSRRRSLLPAGICRGVLAVVALGIVACAENGPSRPTLRRPAPVTDLRWESFDSTHVFLVWTAPSEAGHHPRARFYDLRFALDDTTDFERMQPVEASPPAGEPAQRESLHVWSLQPDTTYMFRLRAADADSNWSEPSNPAVGRTLTSPDQTAPAPVDLRFVGATDHSITVTWSASGDDGNVGTATRYEFSVLDSDTNSDDLIPGPPPAPAGTTQQFEIGGLESQHRYSIVLYVSDEAGHRVPNDRPLRARTGTLADAGWSSVFAAPPNGHGLPASVNSLVVRDDLLYAGLAPEWEGDSELVYAWDGAAWSPVGAGQLTGRVNRLVVWRDQLVAAGEIWFLDGTPSRHVVRWDGQRWRGFGLGPEGEVQEAFVYHDDLLIQGDFVVVDSTYAWRGARWDGERWSDAPWAGSYSFGYVPRCTTLSDSLFVAWGNEIYRTEPPPARRWIYLAHPAGCLFGRNGIQAIAEWNGRLFAAGHLTGSNALAALDGIGQWTEVGPVFQLNACDDGAAALLPTSRGLVVGGSFESTAPPHWSGLFLWDGQEVRLFGSGVRTITTWSETGGDVRAMAEYHGALYVGGAFTHAGLKASSNVARWEDWR